MAKGIYQSGLSCWQRHHMGLPQDNAGPTSVDDEAPVVKEVKKPATTGKKPATTGKKPTNSLKTSLSKDD